MAQRKPIPSEPTPIYPEMDIVSDEAALDPLNPISRAIHRPKVPTRSRMLAEREATRMQFQKDRTAFAIMKTMEIHDHASAETTASMAYSKLLERGFAGDLSEDEAQFYASMRGIIMNASGTMTADAAEALIDMAKHGKLPSDDVENWELLLRLAQETLYGRH
jgi:hypothetical protein